jgi:hypothetical protein
MIEKKFFLPKFFDLYLLKTFSIIFLKGLNGLSMIKLPSSYFLKNDKKKIFIIFIKKFFFVSFISFLKNNLKILYNYFFFRLKLRGLGFRIRKISSNLYKFFFTSTNFFYLHLPLQIIIKLKRKKLLFISYNICLLKPVIISLFY